MSIERLPFSFRSELLTEVYKHLNAGKCGALVGVASSGKSRLVEFMGRPDVRQKYLGDDWTKTLFPWVDGNDLLEHSEWGVYEKVLNAILTDLDQLPDHGGADREKVQEWYWKLVRSEDRHLVRRLAAFAIADLKHINRIVLLLDDFDDFLPKASDMVFSGLRGLRDQFKQDNQYRLLYILTVRRQPVLFREMTPAYESFLELFKNFTHPIGCYSREDALHMIRRLADAFPLAGRTMTPDLANKLYEVTGGHAGLIDAAFHSKTEAEWGRRDLAQVLFRAGGVWDECMSIWEGLDKDDRDALESAANGRDPGATATHWLENSGLVWRDQQGQPQVIEVLRLFLLEPSGRIPDIQIDVGRRLVTINGCAVELTERELALVQHLHRHRGEVCTYQELFQHIYPNRAFSLELQSEVRQLTQRVENKIMRTCDMRRIIVHEESQGGYRLIGVDGR